MNAFLPHVRLAIPPTSTPPTARVGHCRACGEQDTVRPVRVWRLTVPLCAHCERLPAAALEYLCVPVLRRVRFDR